MEHTAAQSLATAVIVLIATLANFNDHITNTAFIQIVGSLVGVSILTPMFKAFK